MYCMTVVLYIILNMLYLNYNLGITSFNLNTYIQYGKHNKSHKRIGGQI